MPWSLHLIPIDTTTDPIALWTITQSNSYPPFIWLFVPLGAASLIVLNSSNKLLCHRVIIYPPIQVPVSITVYKEVTKIIRTTNLLPSELALYHSMSQNLNWYYHEPFAFLDSGVPSGYVNYPTIVIFHGYVWHARAYNWQYLYTS